MIYKEREKIPKVHFINGDFRDSWGFIKAQTNVVIVTDPPFNIGYHYDGYEDKMATEEYFEMLGKIVEEFPSVIVHYPEQLHRLTLHTGIVPQRVVSWVYNSNTPRQHRDVAFYNINPDFKRVLQEYKNLKDKRIQERIARGIGGGRLYDWWNVNQVKNVSKGKTSHPCQMPLEVMKNIIGVLPNDSLIVDCFMGSGTTAEACIELGYDFIGIEINEGYYEIAKKRINAI